MIALARPTETARRADRHIPVVWIAGGRTVTNERIVGALRERGVGADIVQPARVGRLASRGDLVLARLDVRRTLDGVEDGIWELRRFEHRGTRVLNPAPSLLACHDKLQTAVRLARHGVAQPVSAHVDDDSPLHAIAFPVVLKPRFGSWGRDVVLCDSPADLRQHLRRLRNRTWFRRHGALVQEFVPAGGRDLRVIVGCGRVVGAIERVAASGEWRTNIALGGTRRPVDPPPAARALAIQAAAAVDGDVVGVDLLPKPDGGYVTLELNGAVDFTAEYSFEDTDVFDEIATTLLRAVAASGAGVAARHG